MAFNASHFTQREERVRFRAEAEPSWDSSECCLIHTDIDLPGATLITPFVRVAYDLETF